ncbi:chorismate mutase [Pseudomonas sp. SH1-B]
MDSCQSLQEVREHIDSIDREIVALLACRGELVKQAAGFKRSAAEVPAPERVEQVIAHVRSMAKAQGADCEVVESVYRAMIAAFIHAELQEHSRLESV